MNWNEFCNCHWENYLKIENEFLETERYVSFDLGDNYLNNHSTPTMPENSNAFSYEFANILLAASSEFEALMKDVSSELGNPDAKNIYSYRKSLRQQWPEIFKQKVLMKGIELQPFLGWKARNGPLFWWEAYNHVKHDWVNCFKEANLKNVSNALAGLYASGNYFVRYISDRDSTAEQQIPDVPNVPSNIYSMVNFNTKFIIASREVYFKI